MAYDKERVGMIVSDVEEYIRDLDEMDIRKVSDLDDKRNFYSASMLLFSIINRVIDLGDEVITAEGLEVPATYKHIFDVLVRNRIIDSSMGKRLSELVFYRNLLAHKYHGITEKDVFGVYGKINIAEAFVGRIKNRIKELK